MPVSAFEKLCDEVAASTGAGPCSLAPSTDGAMAFHWRAGEATATAAYTPGLAAHSIFLLVDIGPMPVDADEDAWKTLLRTNHMMFGKDAPVLGLGLDDQLVVHCTLPLDSTSGSALHEMALRLADWSGTLRMELREPRIQAAAPLPGGFA